jgi:ketosteroid isomerase-like protein
MSDFPLEEVRFTLDAYLAARKRAEAGETGWDVLADFFTDDATFVDPAWGRVEGIENIRTFLKESMAGLDGWTFPHEWALIDGARVVTHWQNRLPGQRADGTPYQAPGITVMIYAGDGKFSSEEDLLNMVHVTEEIQASGWRPGPGFGMPPAKPRR